MPPGLPCFVCHVDTGTSEQPEVTRHARLLLDAAGLRFKSLHVGLDGGLHLNLSGTAIGDLQPLKDLPITHLCLQGCQRISDFSPIGRMNLVWLNLCRTRIMALSALAGLPLSHLDLRRTQSASLAPLHGMPLRSLDIRFSAITDLAPLRDMPLEKIVFHPGRITCGIESLRAVGTLAVINRKPAEEFWAYYR
jgi:hypothetical protein